MLFLVYLLSPCVHWACVTARKQTQEGEEAAGNQVKSFHIGGHQQPCQYHLYWCKEGHSSFKVRRIAVQRNKKE